MSINEYDQLDVEEKRKLLMTCCGSAAWVEKLVNQPPFEDLVNFEDAVESAWFECTEEDWKEAFAAHPKIGAIGSLPAQHQHTAELATEEQSAVQQASAEELSELAALNEAYQKKFGYIFIVFASGKSAGDILQLLKQRMNNSPEDELQLAADEQLQIIKRRLENFFI